MVTLILAFFPLIALSLAGLLNYRAAQLHAAIKKEDKRLAAYLRRGGRGQIRRIY